MSVTISEEGYQRGKKALDEALHEAIYSCDDRETAIQHLRKLHTIADTYLGLLREDLDKEIDRVLERPDSGPSERIH